MSRENALNVAAKLFFFLLISFGLSVFADGVRGGGDAFRLQVIERRLSNLHPLELNEANMKNTLISYLHQLRLLRPEQSGDPNMLAVWAKAQYPKFFYDIVQSPYVFRDDCYSLSVMPPHSMGASYNHGTVMGDIPPRVYVESSASTEIGDVGGEICFNKRQILAGGEGTNGAFSLEELVGLQLHEHARHLWTDDSSGVKLNEKGSESTFSEESFAHLVKEVLQREKADEVLKGIGDEHHGFGVFANLSFPALVGEEQKLSCELLRELPEGKSITVDEAKFSFRSLEREHADLVETGGRGLIHSVVLELEDSFSAVKVHVGLENEDVSQGSVEFFAEVVESPHEGEVFSPLKAPMMSLTKFYFMTTPEARMLEKSMPFNRRAYSFANADMDRARVVYESDQYQLRLQCASQRSQKPGPFRTAIFKYFDSTQEPDTGEEEGVRLSHSGDRGLLEEGTWDRMIINQRLGD